MKALIAYGLVGLGILLLALSAIWSKAAPGTSAWTIEKEERLSEVSKKMHSLTFSVGKAEAQPKMHGGPDILKQKAELEALRKENDELTSEFKGVQQAPQTMSRILKWSGISLAVLGIIGWYAVGQSD
jgi:hypothetical protein